MYPYFECSYDQFKVIADEIEIPRQTFLCLQSDSGSFVHRTTGRVQPGHSLAPEQFNNELRRKDWIKVLPDWARVLDNKLSYKWR